MSEELSAENREELHSQIQRLLCDNGEILTGWIVCYELLDPETDVASAGHANGPVGMTTWRAMGLIEWAKRVSIPGVLTDDEEES